MNNNDLRRALVSGVEGMKSFILYAENNLSDENRVRLLDFLETIPFSSVKHEILTSENDKVIKVLIIGLIFGQIDVYLSQERSIMDGYLRQFDQLCECLSVSNKFVAPICIKVDDICLFFN